MSFRQPMHRGDRVTAAAIDGAFLSRGLDARVHNLDQYDPSPAVDSHLERIRALALDLPPGCKREALLLEVDAAILSNCHEGTEILEINGAADQLVADLRRAEKHSGHQALGARAIARRLREPLARIGSPADCSAADLSEARQVLRETCAEVPRLMLLSSAVEYELGAGKFGTLRRLVAAQEDGAARSAPAGAVEERRSARHGAA